MKKYLTRLGFALGLVVLFCLSGCGSQGTIEAANIQGVVNNVCDKHDAYVNSDASLSDTERTILLDNTAILREVVDTAAAEGSGT